MQVHICKARISDTRSQYHGKVMDLLVEDGIITRIAASIKTTADVVIAAEGLCVSPGWVDVFADYREPGYEHKETIETGLAAAAAGGSVRCAPQVAARPQCAQCMASCMHRQRVSRHAQDAGALRMVDCLWFVLLAYGEAP
jgi:dihydroorotase-like cyclic amidohydrolase